MMHIRSTLTRKNAFMAATWCALILMVGCGNTGPTATPLITLLSPTATPVLPTATPAPSAGTVVLIFGNRFTLELYSTLRATLETAGYQVHVASTELYPILPKENGEPVRPDLSLENLRVDEYDAILFTCDNDLAFGGGRPETDRIAQEAVAHNKVLGAICNAPLELGFAGVLEGKTATGEPSQTCRRLESEFGATCTSAPVERDGLIITARDRNASRAFAETIIEVLQEPAASPSTGDDSGGLIAFVSTRDGNGEIYVMDADGSDLRRLTNWRQWDGYPTWSPDGKHIAFYSYLKKHEWVIKAIDVAGGNPRPLTDNGICDGAPHWSPDGTRIAYTSDADCTARHREVYVMNADGSGQTNLTQNDADDMGSSWSPDSQQIAFSSDRDGDYEIYIMNPGGGDARQLTDNDAQDLMAAWSPSGNEIAFVSDRDGNDEIYLMDVRGNNVQRLTDNAVADWFPFWSPDGSQFVFSSKRDGNLDVYVMDTDGGNVHRLTNSPGDDFNAVWQPLPTAVEAGPTTASGQPSPETQTRSSDGMIMVYVPGGTFMMGSTEAQIDVARALCDEYPDDYGKCKQSPFEGESPQHTVTLDSFWFDRAEVTNAQYELCVTEGACRRARLANDPTYNWDDHPVAGIPWQDAADYCAWAGGRLPTEAEWEYAARGTEGTIFPWGDEFDCAGGNFWDDGTGCDDGYPKPAAVGRFPAGTSWCGATDMAGNVWEWVTDLYGPYPAEAQTNPKGPVSGSERILRGGSWGYLPAFSRAAHRYPVPPTANYLAVGFRCAASADTNATGVRQEPMASEFPRTIADETEDMDSAIVHTHVCGFLIIRGGKKVLIDSLFQVDNPPTPAGRVLAMREGLPPFDELDLILISHDHEDHFDANLVGSNLLNNPNAVLVSTDVVAHKLRNRFPEHSQIRDRVIGVHLEKGEREKMRIAGLDLEVFSLSHGVPTVPNLGFAFTQGDVSFFHTGDMNPENVAVSDLKAYGLPERQIDIAFVSGFRLADERFSDRILEGIRPKVMVPMHFNFSKPWDNAVLREVEADFENVMLFHEEMTWKTIDIEMFE
jgi:Tol biopolymer transport system component/L-ascorbate metabolism protein UlaG (beta-lactamase superfamily)/putative intracellular protease/amidase